MPLFPQVKPSQALGRAPEHLTPAEREALTGRFVALEIYTPKTLPLRRIEAIGESADECIRQLVSRGLDARKFEFVRLQRPF